MNQRTKTLIKISFTLIIIILMFLIVNKLNILKGCSAENISSFIESYGNVAPVIYILLFAIVPLTLFPDSILAIAGGILFGISKGYLYTTIGAMLGGTISFYISRFLGRDFIKNAFKGKIEKVEDSINEKGFILILLLRLIPLFPFDLISYVSGLTSIRYRDFFLGTIIGMIPGVLVFSNIGSQWMNIGKTSFYISIALLILLIGISIILKKKVFPKETI